MTEKRFTHKINRLGMQFICYDEKSELLGTFADAKGVNNIVKLLNELHEENEQLKKELDKLELVNEMLSMDFSNSEHELLRENEQLKQQIKDMSKFEHTGEHIRLSINIETGELQRHIYATGQWFGDFDRVLVTNWLDEKTYQKFIDRVIEVYNTEFKGDVE